MIPTIEVVAIAEPSVWSFWGPIVGAFIGAFSAFIFMQINNALSRRPEIGSLLHEVVTKVKQTDDYLKARSKNLEHEIAQIFQKLAGTDSLGGTPRNESLKKLKKKKIRDIEERMNQLEGKVILLKSHLGLISKWFYSDLLRKHENWEENYRTTCALAKQTKKQIEGKIQAKYYKPKLP